MERTPRCTCGARAAVLLLLLARLCSAEPGRKVCQGSSNRLSLLGTPQDHYNNLVRTFSNCTTVLENLEITHTLPEHDLSFLQSIEEVSGYVLIAMNEVSVVPLSRLRLVRGQSLYEGHFSLLVLSNYRYSTETQAYVSGVSRLDLSNLTEILNGGVKFTHNHLLCHVNSIKWWDILDERSSPPMVLETDSPQTCPKCDVGCVNGACWGPGPEHCQKFTRLLCAGQCSHRCRGPTPGDCCHEHCAAGCTGPLSSDCLACRLFNDNGTCQDSCPPPMIYSFITGEVVPNPKAKFTYGPNCVEACPHNYVVTDGACVRSCPPGKHEVLEGGVHRCRDCVGPCPKVCDGIGVGSLVKALAVNSTNIESFRNCTKINGGISILPTTFTGDPHYEIPPMDPAKLEYFRTLREITGYLLIQMWPENSTSLSVFENLEIIRGRTLYREHSVVVMKSGSVLWLGLRSLREISHGKVILRDNGRLCYTQPDQWRALFKSDTQIINIEHNAPAEYCERQNASCDPQCSERGCWGPGPSLCVSCLHVDRRGRCVEACHLLHGEPREVQLDGRCVQCHSECEVQDGAPTCTGPAPDQCVRCARAQDGAVCVGQCPQGLPLLDHRLLWKFPDAEQRCQPCHLNCTKGCTGPGLSNCIDDSRSSVLAALVVGSLLVLVLVALVVFVFLRRRRITRKRTMRRILQERELVEPLTPSGQAPNQALLRILKETELKRIRVLGSGAFGTVYKGLWFPEGEQVKIRVAIKVLREATSPKANQEILDEALLMASVDHPHVARLLGVVLASSVQLVTQLMPFGCLLDHLRQHQQLLPPQRLLSWCLQIAKGMSYLEDRHLVHRDLAARNVLVKSPNHVKITDFGLAKLLSANESEYHADGGKVPIKWMALESILQWTYTHQSDVWSYGVTVWEILTFGSKPYDGIPASEICSVLERGERLPQPPICTIDVYMIMVKCWMIDPSSRPRFRELVRDFTEMARDPHRYLVIQGELPSPDDSRFFSRLLSTDDEVDVEEYLMPYREGGAGLRQGRTCASPTLNGSPRSGNSLTLRYITDPTLRELEPGHEYMNQTMDKTMEKTRDQTRDPTRNQTRDQTRDQTDGGPRPSDVFNPNYEDLSLACAPEEPAGAPEYLNTPLLPTRGHPAPTRGPPAPTRGPPGPTRGPPAPTRGPLAPGLPLSPEYMNLDEARDQPDYVNSDYVNSDYVNPDYVNPDSDVRTSSTVTHNALFLPAAENLEYMGLAPVR